MRRTMIWVLGTVLAALVGLRLLVPAPEEVRSVMASLPDGDECNILDLDLPVTTQTAGSALIAEMNSYYLTRTPTTKNACTGLLAGKNLILILAENWQPATDWTGSPSLYRLWGEGAEILDVYAPDWYQGGEGRAFALLTGLTPTTVEGQTAFHWAGEQKTFLPFALARSLTEAGYTTLAAVPEAGQEDGYAALGFSAVETGGTSDLDRVSRVLPDAGPFFLYCVWTEDTGERALTWLLSTLAERGLANDTAICIFTGDFRPVRGGLVLWGPGLEGVQGSGPCSDLDVTPTLLNLFGIQYDSRFLFGRDLFATGGQTRLVFDAMPLVSLYGSAYSDWVTELGRFFSAPDSGFQTELDVFSTEQEEQRYVRQIRQMVYDRYVFARRALEENYFRLALGS